MSNVNAINFNFVIAFDYGNKYCPYCIEISYLGSFVKI